MCETEIKIAYIKKHAYKDREKTTHVKVGEERHTSSPYMKISTMYVKMVTRKTLPLTKISYTNSPPK